MGTKYDTLTNYEKGVVDFAVHTEMAKKAPLFGAQPEFETNPERIIKARELREAYAHLGDKSQIIEQYENAQAQGGGCSRGASIK